ncbi:hypothetical protein TNCT_397731, partial [Trichonephila clavata]
MGEDGFSITFGDTREREVSRVHLIFEK